jgi:hypothetical protein
MQAEIGSTKLEYVTDITLRKIVKIYRVQCKMGGKSCWFSFIIFLHVFAALCI